MDLGIDTQIRFLVLKVFRNIAGFVTTNQVKEELKDNLAIWQKINSKNIFKNETSLISRTLQALEADGIIESRKEGNINLWKRKIDTTEALKEYTKKVAKLYQLEFIANDDDFIKKTAYTILQNATIMSGTTKDGSVKYYDRGMLTEKQIKELVSSYYDLL